MAVTDYSSYLRIDDLLTLQVPLTADADDELLFIVVHQAYELWFKVVLDELRRAASRLHAGEPWRALAPLSRTVDVGRLLLGHLAVLETMSPEEFLRFRDPLNPASGFQSFQFRAIEFLSGAGDPRSLDFPFFDDRQRAWLRAVSAEPDVWSGFLASLETLLGPGDVLERLAALYHDHSTPERAALHAVAERLVDHDENLATWRHRHLLMAGREIGRRPGTGGSAGMAYLETTTGRRLYPALWDVRSAL